MSISVVIPAYNASSFLAATLNSILAQTLPADEILVIDDGSKDDTADIAASFGPPVRVIRRANAGQASSRNFGVQQASSEWIAFLDADDLWEPAKLARQIEELARNPAADLCYSGRVEFTEHQGVLQRGHVMPVPPPANLRKALLRNTTFMPSSTILRRSTFLAAGGFNAQYKILEDWDLWLRLLRDGTVFAACLEPLLLYRIHLNSVSHNAIPRARGSQADLPYSCPSNAAAVHSLAFTSPLRERPGSLCRHHPPSDRRCAPPSYDGHLHRTQPLRQRSSIQDPRPHAVYARQSRLGISS